MGSPRASMRVTLQPARLRGTDVESGVLVCVACFPGAPAPIRNHIIMLAGILHIGRPVEEYCPAVELRQRSAWGCVLIVGAVAL
jgi:hypothetical protein